MVLFGTSVMRLKYSLQISDTHTISKFVILRGCTNTTFKKVPPCQWYFLQVKNTLTKKMRLSSLPQTHTLKKAIARNQTRPSHYMRFPSSWHRLRILVDIGYALSGKTYLMCASNLLQNWITGTRFDIGFAVSWHRLRINLDIGFAFFLT